MDKQRHLVKRQVVDLKIQATEQAQQLQTEVSRIYRQRIVPLIERYCDELSAPDRLHRIALLELDLGTIDSKRLEEDLMDKVSAALRQGLSEHIRRQDEAGQHPGGTTKTASQLELLNLFFRQGFLPWWADLQQPQLLEYSLDYLLREAPDPLRRVLPELVRENHSLQRLVRHFDDQRLAALAALPLPSLSEFPALLFQALMASGSKMTRPSGMPSSRLRIQLWQCILQTAVLPDPPLADRFNFFRGTTIRWAALLGLSHAALLERLFQALPSEESTTDGCLRDLMEPFASEGMPIQETRPTQDLGTEWPALLAALKEHLPAPLQRPLLARLELVRRAGGSSAMFSELERWINEHDTDLPCAISLRLAVLGQMSSLAKNASPEPTLQTSQENQRPAARRTAGSNFSDADELYIGNAGLVILWPFLGRFFERLGLVQEGRFLDDTCVQRGVGLLQYLASEDPSPPEYLLPFNKILCGMNLEEVFDLEAPLTETEMDECNTLLDAVIEHAPILNRMSIPGFRGSFLLRAGILSVRDGMWLLQVERVTYDLVLDRFPWGFQWVKLPWMEAPLRVEW